MCTVHHCYEVELATSNSPFSKRLLYYQGRNHFSLLTLRQAVIQLLTFPASLSSFFLGYILL